MKRSSLPYVILALIALAILAHGLVPWGSLWDAWSVPSVEPGPRSVVVFEETKDRTPAQADAIEALHAYCDARTEPKTTYRHVDVSSPPVWAKEHVEKAKAVGLPAVAIWGNGAELHVGRLPSTVSDAVALVQRWGG